MHIRIIFITFSCLCVALGLVTMSKQKAFSSYQGRGDSVDTGKNVSKINKQQQSVLNSATIGASYLV